MTFEVPKTYNSSGFYDPTALGEAIKFGFNVLNMRDASMAEELNITRERVRQVRAQLGISLPRCYCGARLAAGLTECRRCEKKKNSKARRPFCSAGCGRRTVRNHYSGTCAVCGHKYYRFDSDKILENQKRSAERWRGRVYGPGKPSPESSRVLSGLIDNWPCNSEFTVLSLVAVALEQYPAIGIQRLQVQNVILHARQAGKIRRVRREDKPGHPAVWLRLKKEDSECLGA